jgi:hypothetical protein
MAQRIFLRKNDLSENPKRPYFTLVLVPEGDDPDQEWTEIGALWKAKTGNGYSGKFKDEVLVIVQPTVATASAQEPISKPEKKADLLDEGRLADASPFND